MFMEVVVALKAAAEAINGLARFPDPESYGVDCSSQCPHLRLLMEFCSDRAPIFEGRKREFMFMRVCVK